MQPLVNAWKDMEILKIPPDPAWDDYTQTTSKIGNMPRRRPEFESGEAGAEAAQLE